MPPGLETTMNSIQKAFRITPAGMAIAGAAPIVFLFGIAIIQTVPTIMDPCVWWNYSGRVAERPPQQQPCVDGMRGMPEGRFNFVMLSMAMPSILLLVAVAGIAGAARSRPATVFRVSAVLIFLTIPLMLGRFGVVTLISGICFCISGFLAKRASPIGT